jgi:lambda repressor-like predicted transcriptional regulator
MGQSSSKDIYAHIDGKPVYRLNRMERIAVKVFGMTPEEIAYRQTGNPAYLPTQITKDGQKLPVYNLNRMEQATANALGMTPEEFMTRQQYAMYNSGMTAPYMGVPYDRVIPYDRMMTPYDRIIPYDRMNHYNHGKL